jgi:hypothetical protein
MVAKGVNNKRLTKTDGSKNAGQLVFLAENGKKNLIVFNK